MVCGNLCQTAIIIGSSFFWCSPTFLRKVTGDGEVGGDGEVKGDWETRGGSNLKSIFSLLIKYKHLFSPLFKVGLIHSNKSQSIKSLSGKVLRRFLRINI
jgi:hypothetical protein